MPAQPMATIRMTQDKNRSEFLTRKRVYTQNGNRVFHCMRDEICYRVDPENMLVYKNHFVTTQFQNSSKSWYAQQPSYMKTQLKAFDRYKVKQKPITDIVIKKKTLFYKPGQYEKKKYLANYSSKLYTEN